jgi:sec-independent protein translocase protein TatA
MGNLGFGELLLIFLVLLLVFGTSRLPALGDAIGKGLRNFKSSVRGPPEGGDPAAGKALPPAGKPEGSLK